MYDMNKILGEAYHAILIVLVCFIVTLLAKKILNVTTTFPVSLTPLIKVAIMFTLAFLLVEFGYSKRWIPSLPSI